MTFWAGMTKTPEYLGGMDEYSGSNNEAAEVLTLLLSWRGALSAEGVFTSLSLAVSCEGVVSSCVYRSSSRSGCRPPEPMAVGLHELNIEAGA